MHKKRNLTAISKKHKALYSISHGEMQLELFADEAALNLTQQKNTAVADMACLKESASTSSASTKNIKRQVCSIELFVLRSLLMLLGKLA